MPVENIVVAKVNRKEGVSATGRNAGRPYDKIAVQDNTGQWYSQFTNRLDSGQVDMLREGAYVGLDWVQSGNFRNINKVMAPTGPAPEASAAGAASTAAESSNTYEALARIEAKLDQLLAK